MHSKHLACIYNTSTSFKSVSVRGVRKSYKGKVVSIKATPMPEKSVLKHLGS